MGMDKRFHRLDLVKNFSFSLWVFLPISPFFVSMNESCDRIEVRSYFRQGGKVVGTESCYTIEEAKTFAKYQLRYYPYVEIVLLHGLIHPYDFFEVKNTDILFRFIGCTE